MDLLKCVGQVQNAREADFSSLLNLKKEHAT